jgi:hypothetical protein
MKIGHIVLFVGFTTMFFGISALPIMPKSFSLGSTLGGMGVGLILYGLITLYFGKKSLHDVTIKKTNPVLESYTRK